MENSNTKAPAKQQGLVVERPTIDPKVRAQAARALAKKRAASGKKDAGPASRKEIADGKQVAGSGGASLEQPLVLDDGPGAAAAPSSSEPQKKKAKMTQTPAFETDEEFEAAIRQVRAEAEARWETLGAVPMMQDFAVVKRLCENGEAFFREAYADLPVKLARALRGKIHATNIETAFFDHQLRKVQQQFEFLNTGRYSELSLKNRALKAQAEKLTGAQEELDKVNAALAKKNKLLEGLPSLQSELERAISSEKNLKSQAQDLEASVQNLRAELATAEKRAESAKAEGFTQAFQVSCVLAPFIDVAYYDMLHTGEDDKI